MLQSQGLRRQRHGVHNGIFDGCSDRGIRTIGDLVFCLVVNKIAKSDLVDVYVKAWINSLQFNHRAGCMFSKFPFLRCQFSRVHARNVVRRRLPYRVVRWLRGPPEYVLRHDDLRVNAEGTVSRKRGTVKHFQTLNKTLSQSFSC